MHVLYACWHTSPVTAKASPPAVETREKGSAITTAYSFSYYEMRYCLVLVFQMCFCLLSEALVNDLLMETLIMCYACHTSSSRKIIGE